MGVQITTDTEAYGNDVSSDESLNGLRVLVAEDNELNREIISHVLSLCGIACETASDGRDCLERLASSKEGSFDIVLMDLQMPHLNGKDATEQIRKSDREDIRTIPVIALTADNSESEAIACKSSGMNGYISKPVDPCKIKAELKRVLFRPENNLDRKSGFGTEQQPPDTEKSDDTQDEIFSYEKLYDIFENDDAIFNILQSFLNSHGNDIDALKKCFDKHDYQSARPIIHSLIGVSGNFCLYRLFNISKELQSQVHEGKADCFDRFTQVWEQTIREITDICKNLR